MKLKYIIIFLLFITIVVSYFSISKDESKGQTQILKKSHMVALEELSDEQYPDNPDMEIRHPNYIDNKMISISLSRSVDSLFEIQLIPENTGDDTIILKKVNLLEYIPTVPGNIKGDEYLEKVCLINQEWNRNQVSFSSDNKTFTISGIQVSRIDLARNCLNAYLWEVLLYAKNENNKDIPLYHGWFNFPKDLYATLFKEVNSFEFDKYGKYLEDWIPIESNQIELSTIRNVLTERKASFDDLSSNMYPISGERLKKEKEIIYPLAYSTMDDFQNDSTLFATFSAPGFYDRANPRKTQLSRFTHLREVYYRATNTSKVASERIEIELHFEGPDSSQTKLIIGGIDTVKIPILNSEDANKGQMYSMGIANHLFYETYEDQQNNPLKSNPYFGLLLDKENRFLDSHDIGIDGPLFHFDQDKNLHLWLLSFERHALVGHFIIK